MIHLRKLAQDETRVDTSRHDGPVERPRVRRNGEVIADLPEGLELFESLDSRLKGDHDVKSDFLVFLSPLPFLFFPLVITSPSSIDKLKDTSADLAA